MPALVQMFKSFVDRIFGYQTPLLGEGSGSGDICWFLKRETRETNQFTKPAMHTARKHDGAFRAEDEFFMAEELRTLSTLQRLRNNRVCRATADRRKSNRSISSDPTATEQFRS